MFNVGDWVRFKEGQGAGFDTTVVHTIARVDNIYYFLEPPSSSGGVAFFHERFELAETPSEFDMPQKKFIPPTAPVPTATTDWISDPDCIPDQVYYPEIVDAYVAAVNNLTEEINQQKPQAAPVPKNPVDVEKVKADLLYRLAAEFDKRKRPASAVIVREFKA